MRIIFKRILSVVLTVVMILTAVPFSTYATENEATVEQGNNDVSVSATNSLGAMITETLEDENLGVDSDYVITDLTFEGNTATVSYMALENCNLVVAVYDENTMQMLTSEVLILPSDEVSATVTFIDALPEFFIAKAFLVDLDYAPLCKEYVSRKNTAEFVEFMATKSTDFEEDKVINLDNNEDNNFLVLGDDAQKIKGDEETNVLVSSDTETNTYVFENIDSSISSLKKGDVFHLDNGDMENLVVIKVASITIDGTTAAIVAEASSLEEVFEFVKLDSDELKYNVSTDSAESGIVSEDGEIITDAFEGGNEDDPWKETKTFSLEKEFKNDKGDSVKITGTAVFTLEAHYEIYVSRKWSEISFIINPSAVVTVTVDGVIIERRYKIGHFYFSMYGVTIGVEPEFVFSASANITLTGTWKTQIGFGFNTIDGFVNKSTSPTFEPTVKITGQFYIGFNLAPYLTFVHEAVVDIKFTAEIGITVKATYLNNSGHQCDNCIDGEILWSAKLDVDLAILWGLLDTSKNENYKGDIWNKEPTKFKDFYYSFDHAEFGWGECPYIDTVSGACGDNLRWTLKVATGDLSITGTGAMYNYSFSDCPWNSYVDSIKSVVISDSVTSIGSYAFCWCENLTNVVLSESLTSIGTNSFYFCTSLKSVTIGNSVKTIGDYAFFGCANLTNLIIPDSVTEVGGYAFCSCSKLSSVMIGKNLAIIGTMALAYCESLISITVVTANKYYCSDSYGVLYNKNQTELFQYPIGNKRTSYVIPSCVEIIGNFAFRDCYNLTRIKISENVTAIGRGSFNNCDGLKKIIIPDGVTSIDNGAFNNCDSLETITIGSGLVTIGFEVFSSCKSLTSINVDINNQYYSSDDYGVLYNKDKTCLVQYPIGNFRTDFFIPDTVVTVGNDSFNACSKIISLNIPDTVISIGTDAFANCNQLESVIIGNGVTTIGDCAFYDCDSLTDVYYSSTQNEWNKISIGYSNYDLTSATFHFVSTKSVSDSVLNFVVDSAESEIITKDLCCFALKGVAGNSYTLVTVTEMSAPLTLSNENVLYFDQVVANDCGMISTDFLPKAQVEGSVTLLIGDFGNGTEARVVTTTTYTPGDINLDTSFDGMDAIVVACVVNGMLTEEQIGTKKFEIADANLDGVIDTLDVTYLENKGLYLS